MGKRTYDSNDVSSFPKDFKMVLPDGYRIDTEYDDDFNEVYHLRGGFYINDDGEEDFGFSCSFMTINSEVKDRESLIKQGKLKDHFVPGLVLEEIAKGMMEAQEEQFGKGVRLNLYNSYPASTIMKYYKPIIIFGTTLDTYIVLYYVEITENLLFGISTLYRDQSEEREQFYKHLLNVIKAVRVNGKPIDIGKLTPKKLERALDMDTDDRVDPLDLGLKININFGDGDHQYTFNNDGSITDHSTGFKIAHPDEKLYPHYNSMLRTQNLGLLGATVVVNQTGTEYQFFSLKDDLGENVSDEIREAVTRLNDTGATEYKLAERAVAMRSLFHVNSDVFDPRHDRECELAEGLMHRAYMMSALRSFGWILSNCCNDLGLRPSELGTDRVYEIIEAAATKDWLNYDDKTVCKGLCGTQDLHVYYLPDNTPDEVKAAFLPSQTQIDEVERIRQNLPSYNPILEQVGSLDELRKDLAFIGDAIGYIYDELKENRDYNQPLVGNDADILYAWCALAYAARGPFFTEDGPMSCWFSQTLSVEERRFESEKKRKTLCDKWLKTNGKYLEKDPHIDFSEKKFVFTGLGYRQYSMGDETDYAQLIKDRGGLTRKSVSGVTDYLVIEPAGAGEAKLNEALKQQSNGKPIKIILIDDLRKALGLTDSESESVADDLVKPIPAVLPANEVAQVTEETVIVDDSWAILVPDGFKYSTDKTIIGNHRNIIIMEDKPDNDFSDPFGASISFTSMFNENETESVDGVSMAKMMVGFIGVKNNIVLKDDQDLYVSYYYEPNRSYKEAGEKLDVHHIKVGTITGVSSIQVFFSNSPLSIREQTKLVKKVAESIRLSNPDEKNSKNTTNVKKSASTKTTMETPRTGVKANSFSKRKSNIGAWGFQASEVPANRKKLIENKKGYPIRFMPYSAMKKNWEHDMSHFQYHCSLHYPEYIDSVNSILEHAEKYSSIFSADEISADIKAGKLKNSAPIHALRSFIWTAAEMQEGKVKSNFLSDAPEDMWLDLAVFIGMHGYANYSPVNKKTKRFGAVLLRKEEVRSIYTDVCGTENNKYHYQDDSTGKTMANASISSLFQLVEVLIQTMPIMDLYYNDLMEIGNDTVDSVEAMKTILMGWLTFAFACRQPFFIVPGEYCTEDTDMSSALSWALPQEVTETSDGMFTLFGTEIIKAKKCGKEVIIPDGVTGIITNDDTISGLKSAFENINKIVYPKSYKGPIVLPPKAKEVDVFGDLEIVMTNTCLCDGTPLINKLTFFGTPKSVDHRAFYSLDFLKEIILPEGVEKLYDEAFYGCYGHGKIFLPESLNSIDDNVFNEYRIPENVTIYVYKDCSAKNVIRKQLDEHKKYWDDHNRNYPGSKYNRTYNIKLIEQESPWRIRAEAFVSELCHLRDESVQPDVSTETVKEIFVKTIGTPEHFSKCKRFIVSKAPEKSWLQLAEMVNNSEDDQQLYESLPGEIAEDINKRIINRIRQEKQRKAAEINALSKSNSIDNLNKAIEMLKNFEYDEMDTDLMIEQSLKKIETIKAARYSEAESFVSIGTKSLISKALELMKSIDPYKDTSDKIKEYKMLLDKETEYGVAVSSMQHADPQSIKYIKSKFEGLGDYKDSKYKVIECSNIIDTLVKENNEKAKELLESEDEDSFDKALDVYKHLTTFDEDNGRIQLYLKKIASINEIIDLKSNLRKLEEEHAMLRGFFKKKKRLEVEEKMRYVKEKIDGIKSTL